MVVGASVGPVGFGAAVGGVMVVGNSGAAVVDVLFSIGRRFFLDFGGFGGFDVGNNARGFDLRFSLCWRAPGVGA